VKRAVKRKTPAAPRRAAPPLEAWRRVNRRQLAALLGTHEDSVTDFARRGMPVLERGGPGIEGTYDAVAALAWWREKKVGSPEAARAKREIAQARLAEQTFAARERRLLPSDEVAGAWSVALSGFKNAILAVPIAEEARLTRAALEGGERAVETELDAIARQLLTELAGGADDAGESVPALPRNGAA